MKLSMWMGGLAAVAALACAIPADAAKNNLLPEAARAAEGGRTVQIDVAQGEIKSDINVSNVVVATGGGLLGAIIDAKINADRAKKAEELIQPLRAALTGFDADALAIESAKAAVGRLAWLKASGEPAFGRDISLVGKSGVLDASPAGQVLFLDYGYDTSADFASIRVQVTVSLANKTVETGKKPETRLYPNKLAYLATVTAVVSLPNPAAEKEANVARWSADNGKLAREALTTAFRDASLLVPRALELQEADAKAMKVKDHKMEATAGFSGRVQEDGPDGKLLFNDNFVRVRTLGG